MFDLVHASFYESVSARRSERERKRERKREREREGERERERERRDIRVGKRDAGGECAAGNASAFSPQCQDGLRTEARASDGSQESTIVLRVDLQRIVIFDGSYKVCIYHKCVSIVDFFES